MKIIAVEPPLGERVEGLRNLDEGYIPPLFDNWHGFDVLDRKRVVRPRESIEWTRRLVSECGIFAGISSGASLAGALKVANEIDEGALHGEVLEQGQAGKVEGGIGGDAEEGAADQRLANRTRGGGGQMGRQNTHTRACLRVPGHVTWQSHAARPCERARLSARQRAKRRREGRR